MISLRLLTIAIFGCAAASAALSDPELLNTPNALEEATARGIFEEWKRHHGKAYASEEEHEMRFEVFKDAMSFVQDHNAKGHSYTVGLNNMADLKHQEYKQLLGYKPPTELKATETPFRHANTEPLDEVDWRTKNAVTPVKNQQQCGSCWTFSATGAIEGIHAIKTGSLVSVSEQEIVDCDKGGNGCGGGIMDQAFEWVVSNGGLDTESDYKYTAENGVCNKEKEDKHVVSISGHEDVPPQDETAMKKAVSKQPVSVAIEADQMAFQLYHGGVFSATCGTQLDHGVLVVGYGEDYWLVKNSWGETWGDEGYIKMKQGVSSSGICGILMQPSYPTVDKDAKVIRAGKFLGAVNVDEVARAATA